MGTAEKIFDEVKTLPETEAKEVLDFVAHLKEKNNRGMASRREQALITLKKFRGRFKAEKFNRDECHDRKDLH